MNADDATNRTHASPDPEEPAPSVLDRIARRIGESPRVSLHDEDSATSSPVIEPSSNERASVPVGRSNYQFLGEIARGGMGVILKGHDSDLGRDVAVKVLDKRLADRPEVVQRFVEEAQIGGQLQHPGIVPVYELGRMKDERPFFTMKLVKGRTLATLLSTRASPAENSRRLIDIFEAVCQTLAYAHSRGVIHRDLKPANIMVGAFGEVQVVDWGLAKVLARGGTADEKRARQAQSHMTILETVRSSKGSSIGSDSMVGSVLGTPAYMPPEQAAGHVDRLDERSDVFALGAILCEILTGLPPYTGAHDQVLTSAAQADCDAAIARLDGSGADPALIKFTKQCLLPAPAARPANAGVLAERVHEYVISVEERAHAARAESAAALVRVAEERKARRLTLALGVAVVAILIVGGGSWALVQRERAVRERDRAALAREQSERDARLSSEVGDALSEALVHEGGQRWDMAIPAAERAKALAEGGGASTELLARVDTVIAKLQSEREAAAREAAREADNRKLLAELLEAREPSWDPARDDPALAAANLVRVFEQHGIDIDAGTTDDVAAALLERGLGSELALFFDSLTAVRRQLRDEPGTVRAIDLAHAVDPEPLRADLREALAVGELEVLEDIVDSGFSGQPPITIELLGAALEQLAQRERARDVYRTGIDRFPDDFSLQYRLGRLLTPPEPETGVSSEKQEAVECFRAALALRPESTVVRYFLGRLYFKLGQYDRSIEQFTIALSQRPDDRTFLYHLGVDLYHVGQTEEALAVLRPLVQPRPSDWVSNWAAMHTGNCLLELGRPSESTAWFERALEGNPFQSQFHAGVLSAALALGSVEETRRIVSRTVAQLSADPEVLNNLAWGLATAPDAAMRDLPQAVSLARRSIELRESDASWNTLGVALYYTGDDAGALEALRRSVRLQGTGNVVDWLFLAMAHQRQGNAGEARMWYERAADWMAGQSGADPEVLRFRAEADRMF
jgi:tetratricopeptide (TPR) repeat protein/tRNA A-37 threonylcarbamoyl transferase component Bud32